VRQESNPGRKSHSDVFSTVSTFATPKGPPLAYAFSMRYVLGLDGGGTKTECVLMDESRHVVTSTRGGPSNPMRVGFGGALAAVCDAARMAILTAKVSNDAVVSLCAGLAGTAYPESGRKMRVLLEEEFPGKLVRVCTDMDLNSRSHRRRRRHRADWGTGSAAIGRGRAGAGRSRRRPRLSARRRGKRLSRGPACRTLCFAPL